MLVFAIPPIFKPPHGQAEGFIPGSGLQCTPVYVRLTSLIALSFFCISASQPHTTGGGHRSLPTYDTRYYTIHTDLPQSIVREADLRMTAMAEEYQSRTKDFSGAIGQKLPFYLFSTEQDYHDFGGMEGSAGIFDPSSNLLMALVTNGKPSAETWHVIQHEGFHQFAAAVIGGDLPIWVNEGLAEYFGEGIFTGDGFVSGVIPNWRLKRVKESLKTQKFRAIHDMMRISHRDWNESLSLANYDQAWTMVHFLAHAENGKYQPALVSFMRDIAASKARDKAWDDNFGSADGFEEKWRNYWLELPDNATPEPYARATVQTLTGVLGRAHLKKQHFKTVEEIEKALTTGKLQFTDRDWLPPSVLDVALDNLAQLREQGVTFSIVSPPNHPPTILCQLPAGGRYIGRFTVKSNRIEQVTVTKPALPFAAPK